MNRWRALLLILGLFAPSVAAAQGFPFDIFGGSEPRRAARRGGSELRRHEAGREQPAARKKRRDAKKPQAAQPQKPPAAANSAEALPPPYDSQLLRLSELLGGLAYMRDLCGFHDGEDWRKMMARLRDEETPSGPRRQRLTAAFNRGFGGYELTYRACTPNARLVVDRYLVEAEGLAREIASRYGNP